MADGQVVFEISADGKKAYAAINDVTEALKKAGKGWEDTAQQSTSSIGDKFSGMFGKIAIGAAAAKVGKALLDFGKDALQAASDLQEVQNVVDVTFGDNAAQIEAWAQSAGNAFGLTELQAKRFTSTMGAMLKSTGLAGDQIVEMSTDMAGLAADMASFYNLDFDTAFQKIRSGIAGETEPLKQLGINLSVANLEAFALQQGLAKSFSEMTQGEQTMLRYQYLMQATADAQGDFARTADTSLANLSRKLETNLASIKTSVGNLLVGPLSQATSVISGLLEDLLPDESKKTVLDQIAEIDINEQTKLAQIQTVAEQARSLVTQLEEINTATGLSTDSEVLNYINTLTGDIGGLDSAINDGSDIPANLSNITGGLNPETKTDNVTEAIAAITGSLSDLGDMAMGSTLPEDLKTLTGSLDHTVKNDSVLQGLDDISDAITDLDDEATGTTLPDDLKTLTGKLNPEIEHGNITEGTDAIAGAITGLDGTVTQTPLSADLETLAGGLNPEVPNGNVTDGLNEIGESIGGLQETVDGSTLASDLSTLAGGLNPAVDTGFGDAVKEISGNLGGLKDAADKAAGADSTISDIAGAINELPDDNTKGAALAGIAEGANGLGVLTGPKWQSFADALGSITDGSPANLKGIAEALQTNVGGDADKWENLLSAIAENAGDALEAVGDNDGATTKAFLENVAAGADDLTTDYSPYWSKLLSVLGSDAGDAIAALSGGQAAGAALGDIAEGANDLGVLAGSKWQGFIDALGGLTGKADVPANLQGVADALSTNIGGSAEQWEELLTAVGDNLGKVTEAVGADGGQTAAFLEAAAAAADDLGDDYSLLWTNLLVALGANAGAAVTALNAATNAGGNLKTIAEGANTLKKGQDVVWGAMYTVLKDIDALSGIFSGDAAGNVSALATALSTDAPAEEKAAAWETFLNALGSNAGAITALTGEDAQGAAAWLTAIGDALAQAKINPDSAEAWNTLLSTFTQGLTGELKGEYTNEIITSLLAMGNQSEYARTALMALGFGTDDIDDKQRLWLETCKRLVQTIPGLNTIIDTQTGEIKGGTDAVNGYIKAWEEGQTKLVMLQANAQRKSALEAKAAQLAGYELDARIAEKRARDAANTFEQALKDAGVKYNRENLDIFSGGVDIIPESKDFLLMNNAAAEAYKAYTKAMKAAYDARKTANEQQAAFDYEVAAWEEGQEIIVATPDKLGLAADATEELAQAASTLSRAAGGEAEALGEVEAAVKGMQDALTALADYQEQVYTDTANTVKGVIDGFGEVVTPMQKARREMQSWTKELGDTSTTEERRKELEKLIEAAKATENAGPSFQTMQQALNSQLEYMRQYSSELAMARANGVSDEILAMLSDGTEASFDYLYALNHTLDGLTDDERAAKIKELNDTYAEVQKTAEEFTGTLTNQRLTADEEFKSLVQDVEDAVGGLDMGDTTYAFMSNTLNGIITACGDKSEAVKTAVDGIIAQMQRLSGLGYGAYLNGIGRIKYRTMGLGTILDGSNANGLDYVPYDGYLALLHQGERVQTAAEADLARRYSYQQPAFDYDAMGGAIGASIGRGNVYLDGQTVGRIISDRQGNAYRALERSGWQG